MAKAVLVMDMPKNCAECNLCGTQDDDYFCIPDDFAHYLSNSYVNHSCESKPSWCPLKPMPENKDAMTAHFATDYNYALGWNDCLDAIQGKE